LKGGEKMKKLIQTFSNASLAGAVYAQKLDLAPPTGWEPAATVTVPDIISSLIKIILIVSAVIAFVFLVIGGIKWIMSGGDKEATAAAQKTVTSAIIGLLIVFSAWAIMGLLETFFGIEVLTNLKLPTAKP